MTDDPLLMQILLQFILIAINAIFASAEIALISVNETKLEKQAGMGNKKAKKLLWLKGQPEKFLATIQVGITLAGFLASAFAADNFSGKLVDYLAALPIALPLSTIKTVSLIFITIVISFFTMVLGELVPKRIAMKKAEPLAYLLSYFLYFTAKLFSPAVWFLTSATNGLLFLLRMDPKSEDAPVTEEEIRLLVDAGSENGAIEESEKVIINNIFEFDDKNAGDVMTHRLDVVLLHIKDNETIWQKTIIENNHSYYPVCGGTFDEIFGVLSTRDYLLLEKRNKESIMRNAVHPATFIPESVKADVLFNRMKKSGDHFMLVIDEYGGFAGIITLHNLLEAIVGNLDAV